MSAQGQAKSARDCSQLGRDGNGDPSCGRAWSRFNFSRHATRKGSPASAPRGSDVDGRKLVSPRDRRPRSARDGGGRPHSTPHARRRPATLTAWRKRPTIRGPVATLQYDRDQAVRALPSKLPTISTICSHLPQHAGDGPVARQRRVERPPSPGQRIPRCL